MRRPTSQGHFTESRVSVRRNQKFLFEVPDHIEYMDVSPKQIVWVSAALIPFLEHDDANRALMGSNMQRQAVPLVRPDAPDRRHRHGAAGRGRLRPGGRGQESRRSRQRHRRRDRGAGGRRHPPRLPAAQVSTLQPEHLYRPAPRRPKGDRVEKGEVLADSSSTEIGELALGQNVLVAFLSWEGGNYEDAILVSERLVQETSSPRSTSRSTRSRRATPSWARKRSRATSPTWVKTR